MKDEGDKCVDCGKRAVHWLFWPGGLVPYCWSHYLRRRRVLGFPELRSR